MRHDALAVAAAVGRGVAFLASRQRPWGELAAYRHRDPELAGDGLFDSSPFVTTFALHALEFVHDPAAALVRARGRAFLVSEREDPGLWRYWTRRQGAAIEPDLDDSCCAAFALRDVAGLDTAGIARVAIGNRHPSGLFKTWVRAPDVSNDVDGVVNANVLLLLGERPETHAARDIVIDAINAGREAEATWYYVSPLALHYAVARARHHGVRSFDGCRDTVLRRVREQGVSITPMAAALSLATLAGFGARWDSRCKAWLALLLECQDATGGWGREAFYTGPEPPEPHAIWWGSEELTTAFCIEALARSPQYREEPSAPWTFIP